MLILGHLCGVQQAGAVALSGHGTGGQLWYISSSSTDRWLEKSLAFAYFEEMLCKVVAGPEGLLHFRGGMSDAVSLFARCHLLRGWLLPALLFGVLVWFLGCLCFGVGFQCQAVGNLSRDANCLSQSNPLCGACSSCVSFDSL